MFSVVLSCFHGVSVETWWVFGRLSCGTKPQPSRSQISFFLYDLTDDAFHRFFDVFYFFKGWSLGVY